VYSLISSIILSIFVVIICLRMDKKKSKIINKIEVIQKILWGEACLFLMVYFFTNSDMYKKIWFIFMFLASLFVFIKSIKNKKIKK